jgi:Protein of unknown function (DUF3500)
MKRSYLRVTFGLLMTSPANRFSEADTEMSAAATRFLAVLRPEQRKQAQLGLDEGERTNWHFVPRARKGLPFKSMSAEQRQLAERLVATGLSRRGFDTALTIMRLETVLRETEGPLWRLGLRILKLPQRDPEFYYLIGSLRALTRPTTARRDGSSASSPRAVRCKPSSSRHPYRGP